MEDDFSDIGLSYDPSLSDGSLSLGTPDLSSGITLTAADLTPVTQGASTTLTASDLTPITSTQFTADTGQIVPADNSNPLSWLQDLTAGVNAAASATKSIGSAITSLNPVAGTYNALGQFVPLANSKGVVATPGQTSIFGTTVSNGLSSLGTSLSGALGSLSSFLPLILIGVAIWFVVGLFGKKRR